MDNNIIETVENKIQKETGSKKRKRRVFIILSICLLAIIICCIGGYFTWIYMKAEKAYSCEDYQTAKNMYQKCSIVFDCKEKIEICNEKIIEEYNYNQYQLAIEYINNKEYDAAINIFEDIKDYSYSETMLISTKYKKALTYIDEGRYEEAIDKFEEIITYGDSKLMQDKCRYELARLSIEEEAWEEALEILDTIESDIDIAELRDVALFNMGIRMCENGDIKNACELFNSLQNANMELAYITMIEKYIENDVEKAIALFGEMKYIESQRLMELYQSIKYAYYQPYDGMGNTMGYETEEDVTNVGNCISFMYGTWYNHANGEEILIDEMYINGKLYGVKTYKVMYGATTATEKVDIYYLDKPEEIWTISYLRDVYYNTGIWYLAVNNPNMNEYYTLYDMDKTSFDILIYNAQMEYEAEQEAIRIQEEQERKNQQEMAIKNNVYNLAKSEFLNRLDKEYSVTEQFYMSKEFQSLEQAVFGYNETMNIYEIRFNVIVNENIIDDIFGIGGTTYTISAGYYYNNGTLSNAYYYVGK